MHRVVVEIAAGAAAAQNSSRLIGLYVTPSTGTPSSASAIATTNSGMPLMNSLVPSSGSTIHTRRRESRSALSAVSSESHPYSAEGAAQMLAQGGVGLQVGRGHGIVAALSEPTS